MRDGHIEQIGTAQEIYRKPASLFVARFLGFSNLMDGKADKSDDKAVIKTPIGDIPLQQDLIGDVTVLLRPDSVTLDSRKHFQITGKIVETSFRGTINRVVISIDNQMDNKNIRLTFEFASKIQIPEVGETILIDFDPKNAIQLFPEH
jgi:ABC-type Fe3+/spermidine/putrescine transport system ATPase subunit